MKKLQRCYIFDIDGTLAIRGDRSPFEWNKVGLDKPNESVVSTYRLLYYGASEMSAYAPLFFIFSGRDSVCREETEKWLDELFITYDELYMRAEGDTRKDSI